jgi:hypothetical protein
MFFAAGGTSQLAQLLDITFREMTLDFMICSITGVAF